MRFSFWYRRTPLTTSVKKRMNARLMKRKRYRIDHNRVAEERKSQTTDNQTAIPHAPLQLLVIQCPKNKSGGQRQEHPVWKGNVFISCKGDDKCKGTQDQPGKIEKRCAPSFRDMFGQQPLIIPNKQCPSMPDKAPTK